MSITLAWDLVHRAKLAICPMPIFNLTTARVGGGHYAALRPLIAKSGTFATAQLTL